MHKSDPNQQLAAGMEGDQACLQCHETLRGKVQEHTHHATDSEGSRCYNCHMPYTVFGIMKGERNHVINNPSVANNIQSGRPNACNLCHLDKSLEWTDKKLQEWYGTPETPGLTEDQKQIAASVLWSLSGDANQRAIVAFNMGWNPARATSGGDWIVPYASELLVDPYSAIRYAAERSLRSIEGYRDFEYDFISPPKQQRASRNSVMEHWKQTRSGSRQASGEASLVGPNGVLNAEVFSRLLANRDNHDLTVME